MTTLSRRILLWALTAVGLFVGAWALLAPQWFYDTFPDGVVGGILEQWVPVGGPFNEHLTRDVGALYLGLAAASLYTALARTPEGVLTASRAVAIAWLVFSVPHLYFHLGHLHGLPPLDAIAQPVSLSLSIVLALPLLLPNRSTTQENHA